MCIVSKTKMIRLLVKTVYLVFSIGKELQVTVKKMQMRITVLILTKQIKHGNAVSTYNTAQLR